MTDESDEWLRGPEPGSKVPVAPPPWRPVADSESRSTWAVIACAGMRDAGVDVGPCGHEHPESAE